MQKIFSAFAKRILLFALMSLLSLSSLFAFTNQPALADKLLTRPSPDEVERAATYSEAAGLKQEDRLETYEEETEAINKPQGQGIEKIYEEDLKAYKKENPGENGLVEGAKDLVEKVTGKE
jgi:hypothetical protein